MLSPLHQLYGFPDIRTTMILDLGEYEIREFREEDIPSLAYHANNRKVWQNLRNTFPHPYTEEDAREWIQMTLEQDPITAFALAEKGKGEVIGGVGVILGSDVYRFSGEIGYWLGEPWWGNGIMTQAVKAFSDHAFERYGLVRLHACIYEWNPASMKVLSKAEFHLEGIEKKSVFKDGHLLDAYRYAKIKENP